MGFQWFSCFWNGFSLIFLLLGWIFIGFHTSGMDLQRAHAARRPAAATRPAACPAAHSQPISHRRVVRSVSALSRCPGGHPGRAHFPTGVRCGQLVHFLDALAGTLAAPQALREPRQCAGALLGWISLSLGWIFNDFHDLGMDFNDLLAVGMDCQ